MEPGGTAPKCTVDAQSVRERTQVPLKEMCCMEHTDLTKEKHKMQKLKPVCLVPVLFQAHPNHLAVITHFYLCVFPCGPLVKVQETMHQNKEYKMFQ